MHPVFSRRHRKFFDQIWSLEIFSPRLSKFIRSFVVLTIQVVKADEAIAQEQAKAATAIKEECDSDLAEALPALNAAMEALNTLTPQDVTIVKTMKSPPYMVKLVLEAVCVIKGVKPDRIPDPSGSGKKIEDFWGQAKKMLGDMKFLESLMMFDKVGFSCEWYVYVFREKCCTTVEFIISNYLFSFKWQISHIVVE